LQSSLAVLWKCSPQKIEIVRAMAHRWRKTTKHYELSQD
jgi:hypothetical protein